MGETNMETDRRTFVQQLGAGAAASAHAHGFDMQPFAPLVGHDHHRVALQAQAPQGGQHAADVVVDAGQVAVVERDRLARLLLAVVRMAPWHPAADRFGRILVRQRELIDQAAEGHGFFQLMSQLPQERLNIAVQGIATIERALELTIQYVKDRKAFGKSILDFQNTQFVLAECKTEATVARVFVNHCIGVHLQGKLDAAKARGEKLSRQELYNSFRNPATKTGAIIKRLEEEKRQVRFEFISVLAHELTHIISRDVRTMVIASVFAGVITLVAQIMAKIPAPPKPLEHEKLAA